MKKIATFFIVILLIAGIQNAKAQEVIVTDDAAYTTPATGAVLDVKSTTKGMIIPRMTTTERTTLGGTTPVNGVLVFDTDLQSFYYWSAGFWNQLAASRLNLTGYKFGDGTNYATFEADGTLALYGNATVYDDIMIPGFSTRANTYAPSFATFLGTTYINYFENVSNNENQVYFTVQFPHSWDGTAIHPHIHWSPETAPTVSTDTTVRWGLEYTWVEYNPATPNVFPATTIKYVNAKWGTGGGAKKHMIASFDTIVPGSLQDGISSMMVCRLFRNSSHANDTYAGRAGFLQFDIHFRKNTEGSRTEFEK